MKAYFVFLGPVVLALLVYFAFSPSWPSAPAPQEEEIDQEVDNICSALDALHTLYARRPVSFQDPFSFLGLDPRARPFDPPESSAHPGAVNHEAARRTMACAVSRMREPVWALHLGGDAGATRVMEATFHIGHALEDDATRTRYLVDLQPSFDKMARYPDGKWRAANEFCGAFWRRMGWQ